MNYAVDLHYDENGRRSLTLMQAFGCPARRVQRPEDISAALSWASTESARLSLPVLVEVMVERPPTPRWACPSTPSPIRARPRTGPRPRLMALVLRSAWPVAELQARLGLRPAH